jgi:hypothetical protein
VINLKTLNENSKSHTFMKNQEKHMYAVGTQGRSGTGTKIHLLTTYIITESDDKKQIGKYRVVDAECNGNGSHNGRIEASLDTEHITCSKCLKKLEAISKFRERGIY